MRLFLAVWLGVFALDTSGAVALVAPDDCVALVDVEADEGCPDTCPRCVCCARAPGLASPTIMSGSNASTWTVWLPLLEPVTHPAPRGILHIPKAL